MLGRRRAGGRSEAVRIHSSSLILNPFHGHSEEQRNILDPKLEETIKEYSALDGAFLVRGDGIVEATGLRLHSSDEAISELPKGLGTRHVAAAAITASMKAISACLSQSSGTVTVFKSGRMVVEVHKAAGGHRMTS